MGLTCSREPNQGAHPTENCWTETGLPWVRRQILVFSSKGHSCPLLLDRTGMSSLQMKTLTTCRCPVRPGKALASHYTDCVMAGDWHVMSSPCGAQSASITEIVCQRPKGALCSLRRNPRRSPASYRGRLIRNPGLLCHVPWQCTGCFMAVGWRVTSFPAIPQ